MTYGELVRDLRGQGVLDDSEQGFEESLLDQVWGLIPPNENRTTRNEISTALELTPKKAVSRCVDRLRDCGLVKTGPGGGVWRIHKSYPNELDSYSDIRAEITTRWATESPHDYNIVRPHEHAGDYTPNRFCEVFDSSSRNLGTWKSPDITLLGGKTLPFLPGKFLDVVTFEVKPSIDIKGLYEALAHRASATYSYLLCYRGSKPWANTAMNATDVAEVTRITREAVRTGVGFILADLPNDYGTWQEIVPAARATSDPARVHDFIASQNQSALRELRRWLRLDPFFPDRSIVDVAAQDLASLELSADERILAEDMYHEIAAARGSVGRKYFDDWGDPVQVKGIVDKLKAARLIRIVQGGGIHLESRFTDE